MGSTLESTIILNGRVGSGFDTIGNTLLELGSEVEQVSEKIINFGRQSVETYKDYQYNMAEAKVALATKYGQDTEALDKQMAQLETYAASWAKSTIFHTNDVSNAIMLAARAGLNAEEIISAMPHMISLAQAGGLDLSTTLEMTIDSMRALGYSVNTDLADFADQWAYAANSSTGSVEEFGQAMNKLGAVMRFTGSKEELFSLIGLMHDMGTKGSEAATMIRTSIMRIIAPSQVPSRTLALLGATEDELKGLMEDQDKKAALQWLDDLGFSAYTAEGELKPILTIFSELGQIMADTAGGWDKIGSNEKTINALEAIFGMRGIVGSTNIISALQKATELEKQLNEGAAEGYGAYAQSVMLDTLYGSTMMYESKIEELKRRTGESLAERITQIQESLGGIVDRISGLDTGSFNALVAGMETIAGLGIGLTGAGLAFKFIGNLLTPTGAVAMGLATITATAVALRELNDSYFESGFGTGEIDNRAIMEFVNSMSAEFTAAYTEVDKFKASVNEAKETYEQASATFSTNILTAALTGNMMTAEQQAELEKLGMSMYAAVQQGLADSQNASMAYWNMLFNGGEETDTIRKIMEAGYEDSLAQAAQINESIRSVLMKGFDEGFTDEDYAKILNFMREYNDMITRASAEAQSEQDWIEQQALLHKAQTASLSETSSLASEIAKLRDENLAKENTQYQTELLRLQYRYENGIPVDGQTITQEQYDNLVAAAKEAHEKRLAEYRSQNDELIRALWNSQVLQSDYAEDYQTLYGLADEVVRGEMSLDDAYRMIFDDWNWRRDDLRKTLALMSEQYGGTSGLIDMISQYREQGMTDEAGRLMRLLTMQLINNGFYGTDVERNSGVMGWLFGDYNTVNSGYYKDALSNLLGWDALERAQQLGAEYRELAEKYANFGMDNAGDDLARTVIGGDMKAKLEEMKALYSQYMASMGEEGAEFDVNAILNTEQVDDYQPPNKQATVFYNAVLQGLNSGSSGSGGGSHGFGGFFAEGGRATEPSVFGDAGAEWAIPEEHSERTADLLNAARAASGFTWPDLLARYGGLNANPKNAPGTIVYSPTINANDVTGVREALDEDKRRLAKWLEDMRLRDDIEVYA